MNEDILKVIDEWSNRHPIGITYSSVSEEAQFVINRSISELGYFPIQFEDARCDTSLSLSESTKATTSTDTFDILEVSFSGEYLVLSYNGREHSISPNNIDSENLRKVMESILDTPKGNLQGEQTNAAHDARTLIFNPTTKSIKIATGFNVPLLILKSGIEFLNGYLTFNGELYEASNASNPSIPFGSFGNYIISRNEVINTRTNKVSYNTSPIICIWDKYIIYADGSLSDTTLTWKSKISNTPLDYVIEDDKLYILDLTSYFYIVNLKTRKTLYSEHFEGATSISVDEGLIAIETPHGTYKISGNGSQKTFSAKHSLQNNTDNEIDASISASREMKIISEPFYPTIAGITKNIFGFFSSEHFLGERVLHFFIKGSKIYILTDVGTWIKNLPD